MSHNHDKESCNSTDVTKKHLKNATIVNGLLGTGEVIVGIMTGSNILQADALHNAVDTSMYGMKWKLSGNENKEKVNKIRKVIMGVICLGSLAIGAKSAVEIINDSYDETPLGVVAVAAVAGAANVAVSKRLHDSSYGAEAVHFDGLRHAASDALGSAITVSSAMIAYGGIEIADPVGAIVTSAVTITMNYPTNKRVNG